MNEDMFCAFGGFILVVIAGAICFVGAGFLLGVGWEAGAQFVHDWLAEGTQHGTGN